MPDSIVDTEATAVTAQAPVACFLGEGEEAGLLQLRAADIQLL